MTNTREIIGDQETLDGLISNTLETLEEDSLTAVPNYCLTRNNGIKKVILPNATSIGQEAFYTCINLEEVDLGTAVSTIGHNCFTNSTKLESLILRNPNAIASLSNLDALTNTAIASYNGIVYVPSAQLNNYKADTKWSNFYILPLDDYPTDPATLDLPGDTITDDWATIITTIDAGNAASAYGIGATKTVIVPSVCKVQMQLIAVDTDALSDNTGNAKTTWLAKNIPFKRRMSGGSTTGGWVNSEMRTYLSGDFFDALPNVLQENIKQVKKTYYDKTSSSTKSVDDKIWIPSAREMGFSGSNSESSGCNYANFFVSNSARVKHYQSGSAYYWLRTVYSTYYYRVVITSGEITNSTSSPTESLGAVVGFCI